MHARENERGQENGIPRAAVAVLTTDYSRPLRTASFEILCAQQKSKLEALFWTLELVCIHDIASSGQIVKDISGT